MCVSNFVNVDVPSARRFHTPHRHHHLHRSTFDDFALYCVFDGHNGVLAAQYISDTLLMRLVQKLPPGRPPAERSPKFKAWREGICRALAEVLSEIHLSFAKLGQLAGCTVTIVLQVRRGIEMRVYRTRS